jgi:hypothetical protein
VSVCVCGYDCPKKMLAHLESGEDVCEGLAVRVVAVHGNHGRVELQAVSRQRAASRHRAVSRQREKRKS